MIKKILMIATAIILAASAHADTWPDRPVKIVVPLSPGGGNDIITRAVAQELSNIWKQPVVVENRPGGQTTTGTHFVSKVTPDGYTLLGVQSNILGGAVAAVDDVKYNFEKDFVGVGFTGVSPPYVLVVSAKSGIKTLNDLRAQGQAKGITYASAGTGGSLHVYGALFAKSLGVNGIHVPYKATPQAIVDIIAGNVDMIWAPPAQVMQHINAGTVVPLAVIGDRPYSKLPGVPPIAKFNLKGFTNLHTTYAIFAPSGIPDSVRQKLTLDMARAYEAALPELISRDLVDPDMHMPKNVAKYMLEDSQTWFQLTQKVKN